MISLVTETVFDLFSRSTVRRMEHVSGLGWTLTRRFEEANEFLALVNQKPIVLEDELLEAIKSHLEFRLKRTQELESPENKAKREARAAKNKEKIEQEISSARELWITTGQDKYRQIILKNRCRFPLDLIRVQGDKVVTTRGAEVPLNEARVALRLILSNKINEGDSIGHFTFKHVRDGIAYISCHRIEIEQAKNVLKSENIKLVSNQ